MAILVGSARQDENGKLVNGKAGDQTGKEVSTQAFYVHKRGWYILRPKDIKHANKIAERMLTACENNNIGYDQNQRLGVVQSGIDTKMKTECDCSSLVRQCVKEATGKDPGNFTTQNEASCLENTGLFEKRVTYSSTTPVFNGDVLVTKSKGHTVIVVSGNPRVSPTQNNYYPKYNGNSSSIVDSLNAVGEKDTSFTRRKLIATKNNISGYSGTVEQNTKMVNLLKKGVLIKP